MAMFLGSTHCGFATAMAPTAATAGTAPTAFGQMMLPQMMHMRGPHCMQQQHMMQPELLAVDPQQNAHRETHPRRAGRRRGGAPGNGGGAAQCAPEAGARATAVVATGAAAASPVDITRAVESLYQDQLRPYGRILRKRLAEQAACSGIEEPAEMDAGVLRTICERLPWLAVQDAEGGDWMATLAGRPDSFVDVYSPDDAYPQELWANTKAYFEGLDGDEMVLPGGRYMCAQVLARRNLPFLAGRSLGQIAHIVQLAISQKKVLGYSSGTVVPYAHSQSMLKDKHAESQQPCPRPGRGRAAAAATWEVMREHLQQLMDNATAERKHIPLSSIKRLFRTRFGVELSETALGYAKMSELLRDSRLSDLCEVRLEGHGLMLLPVAKAPKRNLLSLAEGLRLDCAGPPDLPHYPLAVPAAPDGPPSELDAIVERPQRRGRPQPLSVEEIFSPQAQAAAPTETQAWLGDVPSDGAALLSTTPMGMPFPPTPSPCAREGMSLPRLLGNVRAVPPGLVEARKDSAGSEPPAGRRSEGRAASPAPAASSAKGDLAPGSGRAARAAGEIGQPWGLRPLTPSTLDSIGFSVHNTFIHAAMPPPTPVNVSLQHRARSLPRST